MSSIINTINNISNINKEEIFLDFNYIINYIKTKGSYEYVYSKELYNNKVFENTCGSKVNIESIMNNSLFDYLNELTVIYFFYIVKNKITYIGLYNDEIHEKIKFSIYSFPFKINPISNPNHIDDSLSSNNNLTFIGYSQNLLYNGIGYINYNENNHFFGFFSNDVPNEFGVSFILKSDPSLSFDLSSFDLQIGNINSSGQYTKGLLINKTFKGLFIYYGGFSKATNKKNDSNGFLYDSYKNTFFIGNIKEDKVNEGYYFLEVNDNSNSDIDRRRSKINPKNESRLNSFDYNTNPYKEFKATTVNYSYFDNQSYDKYSSYYFRSEKEMIIEVKKDDEINIYDKEHYIERCLKIKSQIFHEIDDGDVNMIEYIYKIIVRMGEIRKDLIEKSVSAKEFLEIKKEFDCLLKKEKFYDYIDGFEGIK